MSNSAMADYEPHVMWFTVVCFRPEERIKQLEKKVNELIEESCFASSRGELQLVCTTLQICRMLPGHVEV